MWPWTILKKGTRVWERLGTVVLIVVHICRYWTVWAARTYRKIIWPHLCQKACGPIIEWITYDKYYWAAPWKPIYRKITLALWWVCLRFPFRELILCFRNHIARNLGRLVAGKTRAICIKEHEKMCVGPCETYRKIIRHCSRCVQWWSNISRDFAKFVLRILLLLKQMSLALCESGLRCLETHRGHFAKC